MIPIRTMVMSTSGRVKPRSSIPTPLNLRRNVLILLLSARSRKNFSGRICIARTDSKSDKPKSTKDPAINTWEPRLTYRRLSEAMGKLTRKKMPIKIMETSLTVAS